MPLTWLRAYQKQIEKALVAQRNTRAESAMLSQQNRTNAKMLEDVMQMANNQLNQLTSMDTDRYGAERALRDLNDKTHILTERLEGFIKASSEETAELKDRLDLLTEAIAVSHMKKDDDDTCIRGCWACHIIEVMKGLRAARKLMGEA